MNIRDLFQNLERSAIEKWCRAQTQVAYIGDYRALCRVLGKYLMYVDTRDLSLAPHMMMNGFWEMWVTQAIVDYVKPGMRCIDVGANCGYYTLLLADLVGEKGSVHAYEPIPELIELLKDTMAVNGHPEHSVRGQAASDHRGNQQMFCHRKFGGSAALDKFDGSVALPEYRTLPVCCVDDDLILVASSPGKVKPIDFAKIDVQGHELKVLDGMRRAIEMSPKIAIAMEFSPSEHEDPLEALSRVQGMGLRIQAIGTDGQVRPISLEEAAKPDTGDHRMLWLTRES